MLIVIGVVPYVALITVHLLLTGKKEIVMCFHLTRDHLIHSIFHLEITPES
jgi:hypothetical protein